MINWSIIIWVLVGLIILPGIILSIVAIQRKKSGIPMETNYRTLFALSAAILCVCALPSLFTGRPGLYGITISRDGIALTQFSGIYWMYRIIGLGAAYMVADIANRNKWVGRTVK